MNQQDNPNSNSDSGLLRFRSAPSSLFSNFHSNNDTKSDLVENQGFTRFDSPDLTEEFEEKKPNLNGFSSNLNLPPRYHKQSNSSMMGSNLMRQSSSPAGFFAHMTSQTGYGSLKGVGNYRLGHGTNSNGDIISPSSSRLRSPLNFSSRFPSLGVLPQISEIGNENENTNFGNKYPFGSWCDSSHFQENDGKLFSNPQNGEIGTRTNFLSHHLSLPKTANEITAVDKFLQFQDTVPCKVRAKRGCATHPRSIAERVRRTRISERIRKLQDLVPNMDKQTNTAEMLDLAVDYIKDLQKQYEILSEIHAKCKCSSLQKPLQNF